MRSYRGIAHPYLFRRCHDLSGRTIALDGLSLRLDDIVRVARHGDPHGEGGLRASRTGPLVSSDRPRHS